MSFLLEMLALVGLVFLNAFFVAAEYGLVTARRTRIIELHHEGNRRARDVLRITADPPRFIAAMQLGVTLTSLGIGALGERALADAFGAVMATVLAVLLAYLLLTFLHVVIGELVPKGIALGHSEGTALFVSAPVRDLFSALRERGMHEVKVEELVRPAHIVPETKDLAALLTEFRRANQHMAIVVDEYGEMEGIVTLEDLLEEIVGEIEDEFDLPDESVEQVDDDTIRVDGTFPIDDFNERFRTDLPAEDYHTMAGFVFGVLGRQPERGDDISHDGMRFDVMEVEGSRILKLAVTFERRREERNGAEHDQLEAELVDASVA